MEIYKFYAVSKLFGTRENSLEHIMLYIWSAKLTHQLNYISKCNKRRGHSCRWAKPHVCSYMTRDKAHSENNGSGNKVISTLRGTIT